MAVLVGRAVFDERGTPVRQSRLDFGRGDVSAPRCDGWCQPRLCEGEGARWRGVKENVGVKYRLISKETKSLVRGFGTDGPLGS